MGLIEPNPDDAAEIVEALRAVVERDVASGLYRQQPRTRCLVYGQIALNRAAVPLEVGDVGTFRYAQGAVFWAVGMVRSALASFDLDMLDADVVTALGTACPPAFVIGSDGRRDLLSYELEPFGDTRVWWSDEPPVNAFDVDTLVEEPGVELHDADADSVFVPKDAKRGSVWVRARRRPHGGGRRVGPLGPDGQPMFPSGLSYGLAGNALWVDDPESKEMLLAFFECRVDPRLSPEEFATMIVGATPPDPPHMREGWELVRGEAERFLAKWLAGRDAADIAIATRPSPSKEALTARTVEEREVQARREVYDSKDTEGRLGLADLVDAALLPIYEPPRVASYWRQRVRLLVDELCRDPGSKLDDRLEFERRMFEMAIRELPAHVLPMEGASEVPEGYLLALRALGEAGMERARHIRQEMRRLQEEFLTAYATAVFPGIEHRWTCEDRLVELGLPPEEPEWVF